MRYPRSIQIKILFFLTILPYFSILNAQKSDWEFYTKSFITTTIFEEGQDIWIGDYSGIVKMSKIDGAMTYYNKATCDLPDNIILCGAIDNKGIKYFGTQNGGLIKYDGTSWMSFSSQDSIIPDETISKITVDANNNIWIGGNNIYFGLCKYDGSHWSRFTTTNSEIPSDNIIAIKAAENDLWISTSKGLAKFNGAEWVIYTVENSELHDNAVLSIDHDPEGNIWLAFYDGIQKYDGQAFTFFGKGDVGFPEITIESIDIDNKNAIWIRGVNYPDAYGISNGCLVSFDGSKWNVYDSSNSLLSNQHLFSIYIGSDNEVWTGDRHGTIFRKSDDSWQKYDPSIIKYDNELYIKSIEFDQNNDPFIINQNRVIKCEGVNGTVIKELNNWYKYEIASDKKGGLFLRGNNGVFYYRNGVWEGIPGAPAVFMGTSQPRLIEIDGEGRVWVDSYRITMDEQENMISHFGIAVYERNSWTNYNSENSEIEDVSIAGITIDKNGSPWIATGNQLLKYEDNRWNTCYSGEGVSEIKIVDKFTANIDSGIWIPGNKYGIAKYDGLDFNYFKHPELSEYSMYVKNIVADNTGTIWMLTGYFLVGFDGSNWTTFSLENSPLPGSVNISALAIDLLGNLWIATDVGILKYRKGGVANKVPVKDSGNSFIVYPNPFRDFCNITLNSVYSHIELNLYDSFGRQVRSRKYQGVNQIYIERENLEGGLYIYKLTFEKKVISSGKLLLQ